MSRALAGGLMKHRKPTYMNCAQRYNAVSRAGGPCQPATLDRDALVEAHLPQVRFIAERLLSKLPPSVDRDDLIGAGMLGLLDAVDKYDPARGVQFKTYAELRVRGAMLDSLRDLDWAPRSVRRRAREVEAAYVDFEREHNRPAGEEEIAARLGIPMAEFQTLLGELRNLSVTSLDKEDDDGLGAKLMQAPDTGARSPLAECERAEARARLVAAIERLPEREQQVVALYYVEELTMKEIGAVLGVTESRVSQIRTQSVLHLRASMKTLQLSPVFA
jgi:RNA polymerase sigma factor for flagellar operon FliA